MPLLVEETRKPLYLLTYLEIRPCYALLLWLFVRSFPAHLLKWDRRRLVLHPLRFARCSDRPNRLLRMEQSYLGWQLYLGASSSSSLAFLSAWPVFQYC